jgi:hypothetical protein
MAAVGEKPMAIDSWLGAVWALFDAGVTDGDQRQAAYAELHRAQNPRPVPDENPEAQRRLQEHERTWAQASDQYERHPERLPKLPPWLPDWVIFPADQRGDPQPILIEGRPDGVSIQLRIRSDRAGVWRDPRRGNREAIGTANDGCGTSYQLGWAGQTGRLVLLVLRPAPPPQAQALHVELAEGGFSMDLTSRALVPVLTTSPG